MDPWRLEFRLDPDEGVWPWLDILLVLSLEFTQPFLPLLGLGDARPESLKGLARRVLEDLWEAKQRQPSPEESREESEEELGDILRAALGEIEERFGSHVARKVYELGVRESELEPGDVTVWHGLLRRLVFGTQRGLSGVPLPFGGVTASMIHEAVSRHFHPEVDDLDDEDLARFPEDKEYVQRFPLPVEGGAPMDVVSSLADMIARRSLTDALREIRSSLDDSEVNELLAWAREQAAVVGIPLEIVALPAILSS